MYSKYKKKEKNENYRDFSRVVDKAQFGICSIVNYS